MPGRFATSTGAVVSLFSLTIERRETISQPSIKHILRPSVAGGSSRGPRYHPDNAVLRALSVTGSYMFVGARNVVIHVTSGYQCT
jgi:hypothetical protein